MEKNSHIGLMKNEGALQNLADFNNKSLLIVDDDNPFRERLARAMEKRVLKLFKLKVCKKELIQSKQKNQDSLLLI